MIYCLSFVSKFFYFNRPRFRAIVLQLCYNSSIYWLLVTFVHVLISFLLRCGRVTPTTINTVAQALHMNVPSDLLRGFIGRLVTHSHNYYAFRYTLSSGPYMCCSHLQVGWGGRSRRLHRLRASSQLARRRSASAQRSNRAGSRVARNDQQYRPRHHQLRSPDERSGRSESSHWRWEGQHGQLTFHSFKLSSLFIRFSSLARIHVRTSASLRRTTSS